MHRYQSLLYIKFVLHCIAGQCFVLAIDGDKTTPVMGYKTRTTEHNALLQTATT